MADEANSQAPTFLEQHKSWIKSASSAEADRPLFFTDSLIVLDTNVLLDLYRYTAAARTQVLTALRLVQPRLWMPYQVGHEFIRNRRSVVAERTEKLQKAKTQLDRPLREAWRSVEQALDEVKILLDRFAADEAGQAELDRIVTEEAFYQLIKPWRDKLSEYVDKLKNAQDVTLNDVVAGSDPILPEVAALYEDRFATAPDPAEVHRHVQHAIHYRYPNKIPPGYLDADKPTPIQAAGDYLIWEEIINYVRTISDRRRVLLVSRDTKSDWYEAARSAAEQPRPWPSLIDEFRARTASELLIVKSRDFFEGVSEFLDADIAASTVEEIARTAESHDTVGEMDYTITADDALAIPPPGGLSLVAYEAARLSSQPLKIAAQDDRYRPFQWWLIGVTRELGLRSLEFGEPTVNIVAVTTAEPPPPGWIHGSSLPRGEFPAPSSTWMAPWMTQIVEMAPRPDRATLLRLAIRQLSHRRMSA